MFAKKIYCLNTTVPQQRIYCPRKFVVRESFPRKFTTQIIPRLRTGNQKNDSAKCFAPLTWWVHGSGKSTTKKVFCGKLTTKEVHHQGNLSFGKVCGPGKLSSKKLIVGNPRKLKDGSTASRETILLIHSEPEKFIQ